jgi:hypothetical protein
MGVRSFACEWVVGTAADSLDSEPWSYQAHAQVASTMVSVELEITQWVAAVHCIARD